ncbi:hypothetical protein GH714_003590 [Hevea brasiliensis]|uniref:Uncharacterized protein n=1 Tax=Hevea brasiliensis TaxID=3981 RepID=A0A6A6LI87_HEVBR|nr:hypothetical protein GH714_003590 [Hevea brasiliensis]
MQGLAIENENYALELGSYALQPGVLELGWFGSHAFDDPILQLKEVIDEEELDVIVEAEVVAETEMQEGLKIEM